LSSRLAGEALDLPGFGRSFPPPDDDYSLRSHVRAVTEYLQDVDRGPVHLFGNSMGGALAIVVAASRPDLVRTLTLISPAVPDLRPRASRQDPVLQLVMVPALGPALLRRFEQVSPEARVRRMLRLCFADPSSVPSERLAEAVAEVRYRAGLGWASDAVVRSLRGLVASYLAPGGGRMWARMSSISAPTLVIWGDSDRLVSVARAGRTATAIPGARLLVIRGVGHVAQMEQPRTVARAVLALLDDAPDALDTHR
jgi:pimeloyl-ACP methyl ester carboxylesterase